MATVSPTLADDTMPEQLELIPLEVLFGNPSRARARIAPDGAHLSWLAPSADGVLNVWVHPADRSTPPRQITDDKARGIRIHGWSQDGKRILYLQDKGGDENWHLYSVDLEGGATRDLTPYEAVRAENLITDPEHPGEVLIGLNKRDPSIFDMYRIDLATGDLSLDTENPGDVVSWITDADFRIRAAEAADPASGDTIIRVRGADDRPWRELLRFAFGENGGAYGFDTSGERLFVTSSLNSDTTRLPAHIDAEKPASPLPMVLLVHGGPWARDDWGYNAQAQCGSQTGAMGCCRSTSAAPLASVRPS